MYPSVALAQHPALFWTLMRKQISFGRLALVRVRWRIRSSALGHRPEPAGPRQMDQVAL